MSAKFSPGRLLATPAALSALEEAGISPAFLFARHLNGDWGDLDRHDKNANERALEDGSRLLSAYVVNGTRLYVITEAADDSGRREATTLLRADEY